METKTQTHQKINILEINQNLVNNLNQEQYPVVSEKDLKQAAISDKKRKSYYIGQCVYNMKEYIKRTKNYDHYIKKTSLYLFAFIYSLFIELIQFITFPLCIYHIFFSTKSPFPPDMLLKIMIVFVMVMSLLAIPMILYIEYKRYLSYKHKYVTTLSD